MCVLYLHSKMSWLSWGRGVGGGRNLEPSDSSHSFARLLIGLLHLLRPTNCLLGKAGGVGGGQDGGAKSSYPTHKYISA